jgi:hypothetical protein
MKAGDRVVLVHTDDEYTRLRPGSKGTLVGVKPDPFKAGETVYDIEWDEGSNLSLLTAAGDQLAVMES